MLSFMFCTFTFDKGLDFWSGLLVLNFTAAVGVFTGLFFLWFNSVVCLMLRLFR